MISSDSGQHDETAMSDLEQHAGDAETRMLSINGGSRSLDASVGRTLLEALADAGVYLPSACGGRGTCGSCKCRVLTETGPLDPAEAPYLSADEISQRMRLACRLSVDRDLDLDIPEKLFSVRRFSARVERIRDLTYDIKELRFSIEGAWLDFEPGQYVQLVIPPYDKVPESVQRAYSMSSPPEDRGHLELLVRLVPGGIASTWIHRRLSVGSLVEMIGPFGDFGVRDSEAAMVCVAGGSGMAPFRSIFEHMKQSGAWPRKEVWYFFGARAARDLFYLEELRGLAKALPRFHLVTALSEPRKGEDWSGETGLITEVLDRHLKTDIRSEAGLEGYLCGSPGMVNACIAVMKRNGMAGERIFFDKFS